MQQTRDAASRGADAVLVVAPHYYGGAMTVDALRAHYRRVADESPVPVVLYSIPKYMHFSLPPALVAELATHENVIGIKDSSGSPISSRRICSRSRTASRCSRGTRRSSITRSRPVLRAEFSPLRCSPPASRSTSTIRSCRANEAAATAAQSRVTPLGAKIVGELGIPGVKAAMDRVGLSGGPVRLPLRPLAPEQRRTVDELLRSAELAAAV